VDELEPHITALGLVLRAVVRAHPDRAAVERELRASLSHGQLDHLTAGAGPMPEVLRTALQPFLDDLTAPPPRT